MVHCEDAKDEFIAIRPCEVGGHIGVMLKQGHREIRIPFDLVGEVVTNIQRTVNDCADGQQALEMLKELDLPGIDYMTVGLQMQSKFPEASEE